MSDSTRLLVGRVGRAHGLDGSFYVTRAVARLLTEGAELELSGQGARIVRRAGTDQRPIVRLEGVRDRAAADALRGQALTVAAEQAPALEQDEWWAHELEGCEVCANGRVLGRVSRLVELPSCEALEVRASARAEPLLVPLVRDAIGEIDVAGRRVEVDEDFLGLSPEREGEAETAGDTDGA